MTLSRFCVFAWLALAFSISELHAAPILYSVSGSASGVFGDQVFIGLPYYIGAVGDTDNVTTTPWGYSIQLSAYISIESVGFAQFINPISVDANSLEPAVGFGGSTQNDAMILVKSNELSGYDLKGAIGPIGGPATFSSTTSFPATNGNFYFTQINQAAFHVITIPEPGSLVLISLGVFLMRPKRPRG